MSPGSARISGGDGSETKDPTGWRTARADRTARPSASSVGSWRYASGPARLAGIVNVPASTVHRILVRHAGMKNICPGRTGYAFIHSAIDAHGRLAYSEILDAESEATCVQFLANAHRFFASHNIAVERVLTDNGNGYRSRSWARLCSQLGVRHTRTRPYRPQTNGKAERFNRTLLDEWAYIRTYRSETARARTLDKFLHRYNHHRHHTAIGSTPMARVNNVAGQHS